MSGETEVLPEAEETPLLDFPELALNPHYTVIVRQYLRGQFRIQITDKRRRDDSAPKGHGEIVQELCTYKHHTLVMAMALLRYAEEPLELAQSWAREWNCQSNGGRIRLDNEPAVLTPKGVPMT